MSIPPASRPRVLLIAEAANPEWVSVPLIGWSLAMALREVAEVHLVTQVRNRAAILRAGLVEHRDFTAIDSEALARPLWALGARLRMGEGKGWTALQAINALSYPLFERQVWARFGADLAAGRFDIVHRVTPLSPTIVSPIAAKSARLGVPFVLGPLNGGVPWPPGFDAARRQEREWLSYIRAVHRLWPGRGPMLSHCAAILAGSAHTAGEIPARHRGRVIYLPENAVAATGASGSARSAPAPLRACFVGRMVPYKGGDMLIEAAAPLIRDGRLLLDMVGDGPALNALKALARAEGVSDGVTFHGWLAHERVQQVLAENAVLAFPSIREFGGGVVLEAMARGLAPLVVDYAGPGELVTPASGYKVPLGSRAQIVAGMRAELARLARDPQGVQATGARARDRVAALFTWPRKAAQLAEVYDWVLGRRADKPCFFPDVLPVEAGVEPERGYHAAQ